MRKIIILLLALSLLAVPGCFVYGTGEQAGYVSAIDQGFFWDHVYIKPTLESTQEDHYIISQGARTSSLGRDLRDAMLQKKRISISYDRHFITLSADTNGDEITGFRGLEG